MADSSNESMESISKPFDRIGDDDSVEVTQLEMVWRIIPCSPSKEENQS